MTASQELARLDRLAPQPIVQAAEFLLSQRLEEPVRLVLREICSDGDASLILRCMMKAFTAGLPGSILIKVVRESFGPYLPDSAVSMAASHLFNDWAAYQFLSSYPEFSGLAPRFYGGDRNYGFIVLEDLNDSDAPDTYRALFGSDPDCAAEALVEHAALLGRLHGATSSYAPQYQALRYSLGPVQMPDKPFNGPWTCARQTPFPQATIDQAIQRYRDCFIALGILPEPGIDTEIQAITHIVEVDPGPFLSLCQGDMDNARQCHRGPGGLRLIDFGAGGYRHALIEGMPGRINWGCTLRIPGPIVRQMENAYAAAWTHSGPTSISEATFRQAMGNAGGRCHVFHVLSRVPDALQADRERGLSTIRQQVFAWLRAFADLAEETGQHPALGISAQIMTDRLMQVWSSECRDLPYYPAFQ